MNTIKLYQQSPSNHLIWNRKRRREMFLLIDAFYGMKAIKVKRKYGNVNGVGNHQQTCLLYRES